MERSDSEWTTELQGWTLWDKQCAFEHEIMSTFSRGHTKCKHDHENEHNMGPLNISFISFKVSFFFFFFKSNYTVKLFFYLGMTSSYMCRYKDFGLHKFYLQKNKPLRGLAYNMWSEKTCLQSSPWFKKQYGHKYLKFSIQVAFFFKTWSETSL